MRVNSFLPAVIHQNRSYAKPLAVMLAFTALAYLMVQGVKSLIGRVSQKWHQDGLADFSNKRYDKAIENFTWALRCNPDKNSQAIILADRAAAYSAIKKSEEAQADFSLALQCEPSDQVRAIILFGLESLPGFNDLILHTEDILRRIFLILKDPYQSLVCKFWHKVNSGPETYRSILEMYNRQEFMTRFTIQLSLRSKEEYIEQVKQIFVCVQARVQAAGIERDVKQVRVKECLGLLELNPIMKKLEKRRSLCRTFQEIRQDNPRSSRFIILSQFLFKG